MKKQVFNPYLPCYEYIPDGEPRVFGDRLYIFGSHDKFDGKTYCENDYVVWSAPIDDLSDWRFDGEIYRKDQDPRPGNLYAPDVVQGLDGRYYLYYSKADTCVISVAVCDTPAGKYEYLGDVSYPDGRVMGEAADEYYHFDPSVLIDEGRVWLYSGSGQYALQHKSKQKRVGCMAIELEQDMVTVKQAPKIVLPGSGGFNRKRFFEGASARKIGKLFYLVFPSLDMTGLNYATSRYPDRDFTIRGSIHSTSDIGIGKYSLSNPAYPLGNNHGGLVCIRGQWYIFDHRMTNRTMFSRQGVAEPVTIESDGSIRQVVSTSCGLNGGSLRGEGTYPAYIACNLLKGSLLSGCPYITQDKPDGDTTARQYVAGMQNGSRVGYKYFDFSADTLPFIVQYRCSGTGTLEILQSDGGLAVGSLSVSRTAQWQEGSCTLYVTPGKSGLFLKYSGTGSLELMAFAFGEHTETPSAQPDRYEQEHSAFVRENGAECAVLLKKDGSFPLKEAGKIALYGSGGRRTVVGGTGSGEVNSRYCVTVEEGLKNAGFTVTSASWLDGYDLAKQQAKEQFIRDLKVEAKQRHQHAMMLVMGRSPREPEYDFPLDGDGDTAAYVLSRISGEGADREPVGGDILLSDTEVRDILACNKKYRKFMLVLNTGGPVDLTPVMEVRNILVLSQLGAETGNILADILLGKQNPSGRLTTTWASWEAYPTVGEFGDKHDTRYREGIYIGYRYFDATKTEPLFPFGYGLSYTDFEITQPSAALNGEYVTVSAKVKNIGAHPGKEAVQLYVSVPAGKLDEPYQVLCGFAKTKILRPGEEETVTVSFAMRDIAPYDEETASYILEGGDYVLRCGAHSRDTAVAAVVHVEDTVVVLRGKNVLGKPDFADWQAPESKHEIPAGTPILHLDAAAITAADVPEWEDGPVEPEIEALSGEQLIKMNLGAYNPKAGPAGMIGNSGFTVAGAAGQTYMEADGIPSLVMADGPAGLRLSRRYAIDAKGGIHSLEASFPASIVDFMSKPMVWAMNLVLYKPKKSDKLGEQYATAIPIGTAIAQSFNTDLAERFGKIVGTEMNRFGVHLWLAPALNIHRSIRCGRNFEYYSEDPFVSGMFAGAITRGVQSVPNTGVTIKHYAFNNQERNRTQNNSQLSERAAREIYLKGFGICVKMAQPKAVMTSYNLVNGIHTSEHVGLIRDILRREYAFDGIVMTDWVVSGYENEKGCLHPVANAARVCMAGGDLFMPGSQHDYDVLKAALANGTVAPKQLQINASRVCRMAKKLVRK